MKWPYDIPSDIKPFQVGDVIRHVNVPDETTEIIKVDRWCFWTKNNWCHGGNILEGGNWRVFILVKRNEGIIGKIRLYLFRRLFV